MIYDTRRDTPSREYLAKGVGVGNYRIRVLDIPMRQLMGGTRPNIERPEVQRFTGKIPLIHKRYINTLKELLEERGYYGGIHNFFDDTLNGLIEDEHLILRAEYLDALKELCIKEVEKGCRKL